MTEEEFDKAVNDIANVDPFSLTIIKDSPIAAALALEEAKQRIAELEQAYKECMHDKSIGRNAELEEENARLQKAVNELTAECSGYFNALMEIRDISGKARAPEEPVQESDDE